MESEEQEPRLPDEGLVREEEEAAAAEAARIGGQGGADEVSDEAQRPLTEAGEGESEGFEQAERDLVERVTGEDTAGTEPEEG